MSNVGEYGITAGAAQQNAASPDGSPEGQSPGSLNNSHREYMAAVRRWYGDQNGELSCGGTSAAYTVTSRESDAGSALESYTGMPFMVARCTASNEASATMNVDGLGAKLMVGNGQPLQSHDLTAGQMFFFCFNPSEDNIEVFNNKGVKASEPNTWTEPQTFSATASFVTRADFNSATVNMSDAVVNLPDGYQVGFAYMQDGSAITGSTVKIFDNTSPEITEGHEFMQLAYTPVKDGNLLKVDVVAHFDSKVTTSRVGGALHENSGTSAFAVAYCAREVAANRVTQMVMSSIITASGAMTFQFRAGMSVAGDLVFNSDDKAAVFNGLLASTMKVTEIVKN